MTEKPFNTPQHRQISIVYLSGLWILFNMGASAPTPPSKCYFCFLFFLPVDMREGMLPGTAKRETTRTWMAASSAFH